MSESRDHPDLLTLSALPCDRLPPTLCVPPLPGPFRATVTPPGSKSLTNRALLLAALATGESILVRPLVSADDARVMIAALGQLGAKITTTRHGGLPALEVAGVGGSWRIGAEPVRLNLSNAGTATRFLAAAAILAPIGSGGVVIDGNPRMRQRPIGELTGALEALGARCDFAGAKGYPPVHVRPPADRSAIGEAARFGRTASSQFISALLLAAPWLPRGLRVNFDVLPTSPAYIDMTCGLLSRCGAAVSGRTPETIGIGPTPGLPGFGYHVEPDASGASYFIGAAALVPGSRCTIPGLGGQSLQGDVGFADVLAATGAQVERVGGDLVLTGAARLCAMNADFSSIPDTAMTGAVLACFARDGRGAPATSTLRGLRTLRVKETDRLAALQTELTKLGAGVEILVDGDDESLRITACDDAALRRTDRIAFDTYDDHRMAMALALVGLRRAGVVINHPACVAKTYPEFWVDLASLYAAGSPAE